MSKKLPLLLVLCLLVLSACGQGAATEAPTAAPVATATSPAPSPLPPTPRPSDTPPLATEVPIPTPGAGPTEAPPGEPIAHLAAGQPVTITLINMLDAQAGWAVGQSAADPNHHILRTADGGATWSDVTPPEPVVPPDPNGPVGKEAVGFFASAQEAWVTFAARIPAPAAQPPVVWRTRDGGQTWSPSQPLKLAEMFEQYWPSNLLSADGENGWLLTHVGAGMSHDYVTLYATADGGQTWEVVVDPSDEGRPDNLPMSCYKNGLAFADAQTGWASGDCGGVVPGVPYFYRTGDGGRAWSQVALPPPADSPDLFASDTIACGTAAPVFFAGTREGAAVVKCVSFSGDTPQIKSWMYSTGDGGQTWAPRLLPAPDGSLTLLGPSLGWWLGSVGTFEAPAGELYQTRDGGETWALVKKLGWTGRPVFVDEQTGWAVARAGEAVALVHTADGGKSWKEIKPQIAP